MTHLLSLRPRRGIRWRRGFLVAAYLGAVLLLPITATLLLQEIEVERTASGPAPGAQLAGSLDLPRALLARVVDGAPALRTASAAELGRLRPPAPTLRPSLTN